MAREQSFWKFESRVALWTVRTALLVVACTVLAFLIFKLSGCHDGYRPSAKCEYIPNDVGQCLFNTAFLGHSASVFLVPLAFIAACFEAIKRWNAPRTAKTLGAVVVRNRQ